MGLEELPSDEREELGRIARRVLQHNRAAVAQMSAAMGPVLEANRQAVQQVVHASETAKRSLMGDVHAPGLHVSLTQVRHVLEQHREAFVAPLVQTSAFAALGNEEFWRDLLAVVEEVQRQRADARPVVQEATSQGLDLARLDEAIRWVAGAIVGSIVDEVPMMVMLYCLALMLSVRLAFEPDDPLKFD